jgi:hypothetical protein
MTTGLPEPPPVAMTVKVLPYVAEAGAWAVTVIVWLPLFTVIDNAFVDVTLTLSVTLKVMLVGPPAAVGVPVMAPVEGLSDNPAGREPESIDQV